MDFQIISFDLISLNVHYSESLHQQKLMHKNVFEGEADLPVTAEEFIQFKKEITGEISHLRAILDIQHKQIDLLTESRQESSKEIQDSYRRNQQMQKENQLLKVKIASLEVSLHAFRSDINRLKNCLQQQANPLPRTPYLQSNHFSAYQKQNTSNQGPLSYTQNYPQKCPANDSTSKYTIQTRKTNDIQDALEDDEEEIECVWSTSNEKKVAESIENHHHNPHARQFTAQRKNSCLSITKNSGCGFLSPSHNFIHKECISFSKTYKISVKKIKVRDIFLIGVGTVNVFGVQNAFRHREIAAYSSNGYIWLNGDSSSKCSNELKLNQTIDMIIDRIKGTVTWSIGDAQMAKVHLPHQMLGKQLYLVLMMFNKDDTLHLYHPS